MGLEKLKGSDLSVAAASVTGASTYARTLDAAKLSESTAKRWQRKAPRLTTGGGGALPERALRVR